jgi:4,5-dihydroxyphthalate decarboxylase
MTLLPVTLACGAYDRTEALRSGLIKPEGIDLTYVAIQSPPELFARMLAGNAFHVSEMSMAHSLIRRAKGDFPFVALPVFPSRMFRHGYIFVNTRAGIREPKDLEGRRIGVPEYGQTAAVWIRGLLQHEYAVDLSTLTWVTGGINAPGRPDTLVNWPQGLPITRSTIVRSTTSSWRGSSTLSSARAARPRWARIPVWPGSFRNTGRWNAPIIGRRSSSP